MKRTVLPLIVLSASLLTADNVVGQTGAKSNAPAAAAPKQTKMVKVATINGVEQNRQFQANVQLVQAQRQAIIDLDAAIKKEKDSKKQAEMKKQLETQLAKLNENNAAMEKAYGFSLARNYTLDIETAHIYMLVTDEEAEKIEKEQKAQAAKAGKTDAKGGKKK